MSSSKKVNQLDKLLTMVSEYDFQENEIFKEITKYKAKERYFISNYGNFITLFYKKWKKVEPQLDKDGYLFVYLYHNGERIHKGIHQLVAECFIDNPAPQEKTIVHHIDFNPLNNKPSNLMYVSPKEHKKIHDQHKLEIRQESSRNE